jgi:hypothetical protein
MDTSQRIQDCIDALEQSFNEFLLETGFIDHPVVRLGWYRTALETVTENPDIDPEFQNGIVNYLRKKISEHSIALLRKFINLN